jgi:alanine racemase
LEKYLRAYAEVNLAAIGHNIAEVRKNVGRDVRICAVIKADAYGHGAVEVGRYLESAVEYFAVATVDEAIELREAGIKLPIIILSYVSPSRYPEVVGYDVTQTVYSYETAALLSDAAGAQGKTAKAHVALDTGMSRIGFVVSEESADEIQKISRLPHLELEGMFTHFSCADMTDKSYSAMQMEKYDRMCEMLDGRNVAIPIKHICNSAGIMEFDSHRFQMVRSGIITYGLYPSEEVDKSALDLIPAMSFRSHVVNVKTVEAGVGVSYGATYVTKCPTRIATVSVGYADGYPRALSNKGRVLIHGQFAPVLGRVCMDQIMVDVSHIDNVEIEDVVTLFGRDGQNFIPVEEPADLSSSFNYEFVCSLTRRVTRVY